MSKPGVSVQELLKLLRELNLDPAIGREEIEIAAAEIWQNIASGPGEPDTPLETAEALRRIAQAWQKIPTAARTRLAFLIGAYVEGHGVKCSSVDPDDFNTWPFAVLSRLLNDMPLILEGEVRRCRARVRRGSRGLPWERSVANDLLRAYYGLTGSLPGDSDLSTVRTPYARLVEGTFDLLGLDGWAYHGREAIRVAKGKVKKHPKKRK